MNGTEFVAALHRQGCISPIVIYRGKEFDEDIRTALKAGADKYIGRLGNPEQEFPELKGLLLDTAGRTSSQQTR